MDYGQSLCEGIEMQRTTVVEMETRALERNREEQVGWTAPTEIQYFQMGRHVDERGVHVHRKRRAVFGVCSGIHGLVASCSRQREMGKFCET